MPTVGLELEDRHLDNSGTLGWNEYLKWVFIVEEELAAGMRNTVPYLSFFIYLMLYTAAAINAFPGQAVYSQQSSIRSALSDTVVLNRVSNTMINLGNISTHDDFWTWMSDVLLDCAYREPTARPRIDMCTHNFHIIGALRLRQLRVGSDSCPISPALIPKSGSAPSRYELTPDLVLRHGLFSPALSLQAYVLECDPSRIAAPAADIASHGEAGDPRCGHVLQYLLPWSAHRLGQVGQVSGCYASIEQVRGGNSGGGGGPLSSRRVRQRPRRPQGDGPKPKG